MHQQFNMNEQFNKLEITTKKNTNNRKRKLSNDEQEYETSAEPISEPPHKRRKLNEKLLTKKEDIPQCSCCGATMVCIEKSKLCLYEGDWIFCNACNKDIGGDFVYHCNCDWDICYPKCSVEQPQERTKKKVIKKKWIVLMKMMIWIMMEIMISI